jgi:hypothetical protein
MVTTHKAVPANGRASPQGQSSTPASQSPNHDKTSPSPRWSQQNYVNIDSLGHVIKDGHRASMYSSQDAVEKGKVQNQTDKQNDTFTNGQLAPSSVYPVGVMGYDAMTMDIPHNGVKPDQSPYVGRRLDQSPHGNRRLDESPHRRGKSPVIMVHEGMPSPRVGPQKPDEEIYSVVKKRVPGRSEQGRPWSAGKPPSLGHKQDIEMYKLTGLSPSRAGLIPDADQWDSADSSVTPPLPALSPSNTPPVTPPGASPKVLSSRTQASYRTPPRGLEVSNKPMTGKRRGRRSGSSARSYEMGWRRSGPGKAAYRTPVKRIPTGMCIMPS